MEHFGANQKVVIDWMVLGWVEHMLRNNLWQGHTSQPHLTCIAMGIKVGMGLNTLTTVEEANFG